MRVGGVGVEHDELPGCDAREYCCLRVVRVGERGAGIVGARTD